MKTTDNRTRESHVMPRRLTRLFPYTFFTYVAIAALAILLEMVWRSVAYAVPFGLGYILIGVFTAFWTAFVLKRRLMGDMTIRKTFMEAYADGTYNKRADVRLLFRSDEVWNDFFLYFIMGILCVIVALLRILWLLMTNPDLTLVQVKAAFAMNCIAFAVVYVSYAAAFLLFHVYMTASVHVGWDGERSRRASPEDVLPPKEAFM